MKRKTILFFRFYWHEFRFSNDFRCYPFVFFTQYINRDFKQLNKSFTVFASNSKDNLDKTWQKVIEFIEKFYDLNNSVFTFARPVNPYVIEEIRDFYDPIRPNMVFYPLNVFLNPDVYLDANLLQTATSVDVVVDFLVDDFIILENKTSTSGISDSALINSFNISQNIAGFGDSGLSATATVVINQ